MMKNTLLLLILALYSYICLAQRMQGYVKTKGRIVNGKVVPGVGLSDVIIRIRGNNVVLSGKDGLFFISLPHKHIEESILIEFISKPGYVLINRDILNRPIIYNPNTPLTIVMEEESIFAEERLLIEKKLRRALHLYLEKKEKEIDGLVVTIEERNKKLEELYKRQNSKELLLIEMVNRYGKLDYDIMSMFDNKVAECIINGEIEKADSLLNKKRDYSELSNKTNNTIKKISQLDNILQSEKTRLLVVADSLHKRGKELLSEGKTAEGRKCTHQAMEIRKEFLGEVNEDYITSLNNYALSFSMEKDNVKAIELQTKVLQLCDKLSKPHKNIGMYTMNMGRFYYLIEDHDNAIIYWEQALPLVEKNGELYMKLLEWLGMEYIERNDVENGSRIMALTEEHNQHESLLPCDEPGCMTERAEYYSLTGENVQAKDCYLKALAMKMTPEQKVKTYESYARFLSDEKNWKASAEYYYMAAEAKKQIEGETEDYIQLVYNAAVRLYLGNQYEKSLFFYNSVVTFYEKNALKVAQKNIAQCHKGMGIVYSAMKDYASAKEEFLKSLSYYAKEEPQTQNHALIIERLATAEKFNKEYVSSIIHYRQAIRLYDQCGMKQEYSDAEQSLRLCCLYAESDYSNMDTNVQKDFLLQMAEIENENYEKTMSVASRLLNDLYDDENALKYYNKALKIAVDRSGGLGNPDIASAHQNIGKVYSFQGNFAKAIEEYSLALSLQRELMGDSTRHVGQSQILLGITYNSMKKFDLALEYYEDALNIYKYIFKENNSSEIANIYNNMAVTYENKKDNKQALLYYEKALNMRKELYDYEHSDIAYSYSNIAGIYDNMEEYDKAIAYYQNSIDVLKKSKGTKHQDVGLMYNNIAATYYNMDELEISLSYFNQALEIMQIFMPDDHPNIRAILENIDIVKNEIKRN